MLTRRKMLSTAGACTRLGHRPPNGRLHDKLGRAYRMSVFCKY